VLDKPVQIIYHFTWMSFLNLPFKVHLCTNTYINKVVHEDNNMTRGETLFSSIRIIKYYNNQELVILLTTHMIALGVSPMVLTKIINISKVK
jgi:hypothetical protein